MEKITYIGLERCDFIFQVAKALSLQGEVLINDRSESLELLKTLSPYEDLSTQVEWRNILIVKDKDLRLSDVSAFTYVIEYVGMNFEEKDFYNNKVTLIMPDFSKYSISKLEKILPVNVSNPIYILRDACSKKYTQKSIATYLSIHPKEITGFIPLSIEDQSSYVTLTHNRNVGLKNLSEEFKEGLEYVIAKIFDIENDARKIKKIIKVVEKIK